MIERLPGFVTKTHRFQVPLDYQNPKAQKIEIFAREVCLPENESKSLPWIVFQQGGPGFPSPRPGRDSNAVLGRFLRDYRVLLLDQRGTGLSSRISHRSLFAMGSAKTQAKYLRNFRADSIVQDSEWIRKSLVGKNQKWTLLGQSYGGFVATTYLSFASEGLEAALITGGIPPTNASIEDIYRATSKRVIGKNRLYYERFPDDEVRVRKIVDYLRKNKVLLPSGDRLSPERFLQIGLCFGMGYGFQPIHYLVEEAFELIGKREELAYVFCRGIENALSFDTNPIYSLLHEACYCESFSSRWAADRVQSEFPELGASAKDRYCFSGEMIFEWMFKQYKVLKPLHETARILADFEGWGPLYDLPTLQANRVPTAAVVYYDDMYVDRELCESTAKNIKGIKLWITNQFEHDGIRSQGDEIAERMLAMIRGHASPQTSLI